MAVLPAASLTARRASTWTNPKPSEPGHATGGRAAERGRPQKHAAAGRSRRSRGRARTIGRGPARFSATRATEAASVRESRRHLMVHDSTNRPPYLNCPRCGLTVAVRVEWLAVKRCPRCLALARTAVDLRPCQAPLQQAPRERSDLAAFRGTQTARERGT
jgi:hypothetical protein